MKVLLISPLKMTTQRPPLGLGYLASVLRNNLDDVELGVIDFNTLRNENETKDIIQRFKPDVAGISMMVTTVRAGLDVAKQLKENDPETIVVAGGAQPTVMPEEIISDENIDFVVIGEGEYTFLDLVRAVDNDVGADQVKGIYYKENGAVKQTGRREFIQDLDDVPFPARDLLPMKHYLGMVPQFPFFPSDTHVMAVRGCPYNCFYCQPTGRLMFGRKARYRSPANIVDEMESVIKDYNPASISISGDTLTANKKWTYEFCDEIKNRGIEMPLTIGTRVDCVDKEMLQKLKEIGVYYIMFGVESGSQRILDEIMHKQITIQQIKDAFRHCKEIGIMPHANFMLGAPTETKDEVWMSYQLLKDIQAETITTDDITKLERHGMGTMKRYLSDAEIGEFLRLFWHTTTKYQLTAMLRPWANKHFVKHVLKREVIKLRKSQIAFIRDMLKRPLTLGALIKYKIYNTNKNDQISSIRKVRTR